jgi:integrase
MAKALTTRTVETTKPTAERREIPDGLLPRFYFVVEPTGSKGWCIRYRFQGIPRRHVFGSYPAYNLLQARKAAAEKLRAVAEGRDPALEKREARTGKPGTVAAYVDDFLAEHCELKNKPRTKQETKRNLTRHVLPHWRGRALQSITRQDVRTVLKRVMAAGTPIAANRTFASTRKFFNWCVGEGHIETSPCAGLANPAEERDRDRVLSDGELRLVMLAATELGGAFGALVRLLTLTGARRDEVARMRWSELNLDGPEGPTWTLPAARTKNGLEHEIALSDAALEILGVLPRFPDCDFVLSNDGKTAASNFGKNKRRLDALLPADVRPWRLRDLRRTAASGMAKLGVTLPVIERCLNHVSGSFAGITGVYQKHDYAPERRHAFQRWGEHISGLVSGRPAKVVNYRRG